MYYKIFLFCLFKITVWHYGITLPRWANRTLPTSNAARAKRRKKRGRKRRPDINFIVRGQSTLRKFCAGRGYASCIIFTNICEYIQIKRKRLPTRSLFNLEDISYGNVSLKGQCHEIFGPQFFFYHQSTPHRTLLHRLKPFRIWIRIRRNNRFENRQNRIPRSQWDSGIRLASQSSALIFTFYSTVTICMWRLLTYLFLLWFFLKEIRANNCVNKDSCGVIRFPRSHRDRVIRSRGLIVTWGGGSHWKLRNRSRGHIETAATDPTVPSKPGEKDPAVGIRSLQTFISNNLANTKSYANRPVNQGPRDDCLMNKTEDRKYHDTVP
jgi:hypothetical protein